MMKRILFLFAATSLFLGSCASHKLAQQKDVNDDVYNSVAKAKELPEYTVASKQEKQPDYRTNDQLYGGSAYGDYSRDYYDYSYTSRINRYYYQTPWRSTYYNNYYSNLYDPWYGYGNRFGYAYSPGVSVYIGLGSRLAYDPFDSFFYGYPTYYGSRYWGPVSYYSSYYPGYSYNGYGYGGSGYYNGGSVYNDPNYRPRPNREAGINRSNGLYNNGTGSSPGAVTGRPQRSGVSPSGSSSPNGNGRVSSQPSDNSSQPAARPARPARDAVTQPAPVQRQPDPAPVYSRPSRNDSPPPSQPAPSSGGSSPSSGGGSSRPSRGD